VGVAGEVAPLRAVQRARRKLADVGPAYTRSEGDFERVSLPNDDCDALRDVLVAEGARVVIEIGLAYASSSLAIAEALLSQGHREPEHIIIDAFQHEFGDVGWDMLCAAGLRSVCALVRDRSQMALPRLASEGVIADAAFVDGSHIFHNVFVDLYFLRDLVRPGGLVVLDDCEWASVATAVAYFEANAGWQPHRLGGRTRLRAFRLPEPRVEPKFEDFQAFGPAAVARRGRREGRAP